MQQFIVPQFIDVENKILGPIGTRQFVILLIGGGLIFISFRLADITLFIIEAFIILAFTITFAFIKVNGRPFHKFLGTVYATNIRPKLRVWNNKQATDAASFDTIKKEEKSSADQSGVKIIKPNKLSELSLIVDTGGVYEGEGE